MLISVLDIAIIIKKECNEDIIIMIYYDGDGDDNEYLRGENMSFNITQT